MTAPAPQVAVPTPTVSFVSSTISWLMAQSANLEYKPYTTILVLLSAAGLLWLARRITLFYWRSYLNLPGPQADTFWDGSLPALFREPTGKPTGGWLEQYGSTILVRHSMYRPDVMTIDPLFVKTALHSDAFTVGDTLLRVLTQLGMPLSIAAHDSGPKHQRLKRAMTPAFGAPVMKALWPDILDLARQLGDKLEMECVEHQGKKTLVSSTEYALLFSMDVLGKCCFGQDLGAIAAGKPSSINITVGKVVRGTRVPTLLDNFDCAGILPFKITQRGRDMHDAKTALRGMARQILRQRKEEVLSEISVQRKRDEFVNKDVISLLLRASMASDTPASLRLSDEEVEDQIPLLIFAGNLTTVTTIGWFLHCLATHPEVQAKLRAEVQQVATDQPDFGVIDNLTYLDATTKEVVRLYATGHLQSRTVQKKVTVPLSEPVRGRNGKMMHTVTLDKGSVVRLPLPNLGRSTTLYGPDAHSFRPERHLRDDLEEVRTMGGTWGNSFSFSGGERSCMGWRMSVAEIKALMFVLLRKFEISEPEGMQIQRIGMIEGSKNVVSGTKDADYISMPIIFKLL